MQRVRRTLRAAGAARAAGRRVLRLACPETGAVGGKGAYQHLPNACTVLYGGTRAALHEFCGRDGRCVLLVPLAPLAHLARALLRLLAFDRRRPYKLPPCCFWTSIMALGGGADQICTI